MSQYFLNKLGRFYQANINLQVAISTLCQDLVELDVGTELARQGAPYKGIYLLNNGWVFRSKTLEDGARQIVNVAIPGDFVGLNSLLFYESEFDLIARTPITAYKIDHNQLREIMKAYPSFAAALVWADAHEESILAERIVTLGRRTAEQRASHVLCEFVNRLQAIEPGVQLTFHIPISQNDFADILGMSLVHTNKTLRRLEVDGLISFRHENLVVHDLMRLQSVAGFDDGYMLFIDRPDKIREV